MSSQSFSHSRFLSSDEKNKNDKKHTLDIKPQKMDRELLYIGPLGRTVKQFKWFSFLVGSCGYALTPYILAVGKEPVIGSILVPINLKMLVGHDLYYSSLIPVGIASLIPIILVNFVSAPYVSRFYIEIPRSIRLRARKASFNPKLLSPENGDPFLIFERYDWLGRLYETRVPLSELQMNKRSYRMALWEQVKNNGDKGTRLSHMISAEGLFFVEKKSLKEDTYTSALLDWIENNSEWYVKRKIQEKAELEQWVRYTEPQAKQNAKKD
ncbi:hypothetical protein G9A89_011757 [Geosiphon pyriformis]|nr:hypothetical protein G9A89_011757 [Geosiphon pyriformis]